MNRQQIAVAIGKLISNDRNRTHGDPHLQFWMAQTIKGALREGPRWAVLSPQERETLEMLATKLSRIVCGSSHSDHYKDIAGYAVIAAEGVEQKKRRKI